MVASLLYYGFGLTVAIQSRDRIVNTQRGLVGLVGEARGKLAPEGPVFVKGALWRGRSTGDRSPPGPRSGCVGWTAWSFGSSPSLADDPDDVAAPGRPLT